MIRLPARAPLVIAATAGALLGATKLASLDLPLALANGDRLLAHGEIARTNVWSWVRPDYPYLSDKWAFDAMVAAANAALGDTGLVLLKMTLGAAMGVLLFLLCRRGTDGLRATGLAALALTMLSYRLFLRAEWMSYLFLAATLLLLPSILARRRAAEIGFVALVPVAAAFHAYWFLGPLVVVVSGAFDRSLRTVLVGVAGVGAAAISPFGISNVLHPLRISRQLSGTDLGDAISELHAPFLGGAPATFFHALAIVLLAAALAAFVALLRSKRGRDAAVLALLVAIGVRFDRNLAMLGLAVPLIADAPCGERTRTAFASLGLVAVLALGGVATRTQWFLAGREPGFGWQDGVFPARLGAELGPSKPGARYVNDLSIGSFLVRARGEAFIDGNTHGYPPEFFAKYRRTLTGEIGIAEIDANHPNDGWCLRHNAPTSREMILGLFLSNEYAPSTWDDVATLFRKDADPDRADVRWRQWLHDVYLPRALPWFPSDDECMLATKADPDWGRKAAVLCPWRARYYEEMARRYAETGDALRAARCLRYASRLE